MTHKFDILITGGTVHDGTGAPPFEADIGIIDGCIAAVGRIEGGADTVIEANGMIVTPGFVDVHTHYDAQVTWSSNLTPSSMHGVTTAVIGNCGVGFAPCRPQDRHDLIELMEGVEDIPEVVMAEGLSWDWESFPEFLATIGSRSYDIDVAAQLPHSALRLYVMGKRAMLREAATPRDIKQMARLAREAMQAGAIGFSTSRTLQHRSGAGAVIPTYGAAEAELLGIAKAMQQSGAGVIELAMDLDDIDDDFDMMERIAGESGVPISYGLAQYPSAPSTWRYALERSARAAEMGLNIKAQVAPRGIGMLFGHDVTSNPFSFCETYKSLANLPRNQRMAALRDPQVRAQILAEPMGEAPQPALERIRDRLRQFSHMFILGPDPDYEPDRESSLERMAAARNVSPEELAYDAMLEQDGTALLYLPGGNFVDFSLDPSLAMITDDNSIVALGDGGAHFGSICDASYPTFMLAHWARDRRGTRLPVERVIELLTSRPASAVGLHDRGRIARGLKADINIIDHARIGLSAPEVVHDLPAGGRRLVQEASGYAATIVSGTLTRRDGASTGALPGRLVRGAASVS